MMSVRWSSQTQSEDEAYDEALEREFEDLAPNAEELPKTREWPVPEGYVRYYLNDEDSTVAAPAEWDAVRRKVDGNWEQLFGAPAWNYHFFAQSEEDDGAALNLSSFRNVIHVEGEFEGGVPLLTMLLTDSFLGESFSQLLAERSAKGLPSPPSDLDGIKEFHQEVLERCGLRLRAMTKQRVGKELEMTVMQIVREPNSASNPSDISMAATAAIAAWPDDGTVMQLGYECPDSEEELKETLDGMFCGTYLNLSRGPPFSFKRNSERQRGERDPLVPLTEGLFEVEATDAGDADSDVVGDSMVKDDNVEATVPKKKKKKKIIKKKVRSTSRTRMVKGKR